MGNSASRNRTQNPPPQPQQSYGYTAQYPPATIYPPGPQGPLSPYQPHYGQRPPYQNNGQMYGGWSPPAPAYSPGSQAPNYPGQQLASARSAEKTLENTQTIRNCVNLKKATLRVVPLAGNFKELAILFSFDATHPCMVSTFVSATEHPADGCRIQVSSQPASKIFYPKGLNMKFPKEGETGAVVDLGVYDEATLASASEDRFPLIVRMSCIADTPLAEGHSLEELQAGEPLKVWVQSQTTFAAIVKDDEGVFQAKVLKQKIWVAGTSYELQEIYGLEQASHAKAREGAAASGAPTADDSDERLCVICLSNDRNVTVIPCRHMCMCDECAQELRKQSSKCPICRNHVMSLLHIKVQNKSRPPVHEPVDKAVIEANVKNKISELRVDDTPAPPVAAS